jgi:TonB family protein
MTEAWKQWEGHVVDGRFVLREFQGSSDHSAVFLTNSAPRAQNAAIKFVLANPASAQLQLSRWERVAKLSHPHLIRLLHWGQCQLGDVSMLYVVTEFAEENLSQILPNRALTPSETEYMLRAVLEVLAYLHSAGLAHSRLKPANVMAVGDDLRLSSDTICGVGERKSGPREPTVYDAPEIASTGPSPAGDMWSLGVTLVAALTQRPSPGEAIRQGDPALPETIPAPFLDIARQCLRLDPQRRWAVPDIAARLLPASAPPQKSQARARYVLAVFAALAVGVLLAGPKLLQRSPGPAPPQPRVQMKDPGPPAPQRHRANVADSTPPPSAARRPAETRHENPTPPVATSTTEARSKKSVPGSVPGGVSEQVMPAVSQRSRNTITGKVRVVVRVAVDPSGHVMNATLDSSGPSRYFASVAQDASRRWKFTPPQVDGEAVASEWILRFAFGREDVEVAPVQVSP